MCQWLKISRSAKHPKIADSLTSPAKGSQQGKSKNGKNIFVGME
jgi:hypothetical protein